MIENLRDIASRQNLSGLPVLETRPSMGWIFKYRLVDFYFKRGKKKKRWKGCMYRGYPRGIKGFGPMQWLEKLDKLPVSIYSSYVESMCLVSLSLRTWREYFRKSISWFSWLFMLFFLFMMFISIANWFQESMQLK